MRRLFVLALALSCGAGCFYERTCERRCEDAYDDCQAEEDPIACDVTYGDCLDRCFESPEPITHRP